ncbi:MAG TPA: hypothetical protein VEU96_10040 [Bryobacteraceae bacterium]|nr:hypothetical protein [Bryobacteraceae bacterium]
MNTTTAAHIPFVNTETDCRLFTQHFGNSVVARICIDNFQKLRPKLPQVLNVWIDAGLDALDHLRDGDVPRDFVRQFGDSALIQSLASGNADKKADVQQFVNALLNKTKVAKPTWLSIPQLPLVEGSTRNKTNRLLAEATRSWATEQGYRGKLILPIIVTNQRQINKKTDRDVKVKVIKSCYEKAAADGLWIVESSLNDQEGSGKFDNLRFPSLIKFHQEVAAALPAESISVAGPYWGLNLVLWARGIAKHPVVGLGNSFQYRIPGGHMQPSSARIALSPLKRLAVMKPDLKSWLSQSLSVIPMGDPAHAQLQYLLKNFDRLQSQESRTQVAKFYKDWFDRIAATNPAGRALALYQDFSSAYVLGKGLPNLPDEKTARRPERIAQQLMLTCL